MGLRINDCTSGFRCFRKGVLERLDFSRVTLKGYGFLIQMLYEINRNKFTISERPIFFDERTKGASKMSSNIALEAFFSLAAARLKDIFFRR